MTEELDGPDALARALQAIDRAARALQSARAALVISHEERLELEADLQAIRGALLAERQARREP